MQNTKAVGILYYGTAASSSAFLAGPDVQARIEPLFLSDDDGGFGIDGGPRWWRVQVADADGHPFGVADGPVGVARAWDACHEMVSGRVLEGEAEYAEPDLEYAMLPPQEEFAGAEEDGCPASPGDGLWYRDDGYGGFDAANLMVSRLRKRVRVAHFDTGYIPRHPGIPRHLLVEEARSFVDGERGDDAVDLTEGIGTQKGHGAATMALLAGERTVGDRHVGVAPFAQVIPYRIANRVYHIRTSAIARAFDDVHRLNQDERTFVNVVTMSMGGLPSRAWAEAVNAVYEDGTFIVTAAGNNVNNFPTYEVVYPARFERVVAATGVMADMSPYHGLGAGQMTGNYGPPEAMTSALAAYTPQVPWSWRGQPAEPCFDGGGTSSATPQIAGAAALWIRKNSSAYESYAKPWQRVEAIRKALFDSADASGPIGEDIEHYGAGRLRADAALGIVPDATELTMSPAAEAGWAFWRLLPNLFLDGEEAPSSADALVALEAEQLLLKTSLGATRSRLERLAAMPHRSAEEDAEIAALWSEISGRLAGHEEASAALRNAFGRIGTGAGSPQPGDFPPPKDPPDLDSDAGDHTDHGPGGSPGNGAGTAFPPPRDPPWRDTANLLQALGGSEIPTPSHRHLRVYAVDPSLQADLATFPLTTTSLAVRWEHDLEPGPVGEYIEVVDIDPASGAAYVPVDLNDPSLLSSSGFAPSESNPQFHQQMVYAVAMKTIEHFETALGRVALWAPRGRGASAEYVQRLRIYPHALRRQNAFYSPSKKALLFGYFVNERDDAANIPGGLVFNCLSHDIIAHETSHALLDGLHAHFAEPTNPDVLAFHEAFSDIVAIFQHFTMTDLLRDQLRRTGGDLRRESLLSKLAMQFGQARGRGALREYLGRLVPPEEAGAAGVGRRDPVWVAHEPRPDDYENARADAGKPHQLGAVLVGAMLEAFVDVYERETRQDILIATGGVGVFGAGELPTHLLDRLAERASDVADRFLTICIRALDYCPPVDINFGDYLRAVVTTDRDLSDDEEPTISAAVIAAFRERGIRPDKVRHLSVDSVLWKPPPLPMSLHGAANLLDELKLSWSRDTDRRTAFDHGKANVKVVADWLPNLDDEAMETLGFYREDEPITITLENGDSMTGIVQPIEIHSVRPSVRAGKDGRIRTDIVIEATQGWTVEGRTTSNARTFRGGCTVLIDPATGRARYAIRKSVAHATRIETQLRMRRALLDEELHSLARNYRFGEDRPTESALAGEPFAALHDVSHFRGDWERASPGPPAKDE